ncbi:hypothetical protein BY996DRAFT_6568672 [Phakopsora pachyrhizi]|nr:hypothetical protein BY996DRAFT_6568672 [Phakopsora pachyrhizi]
MVVVDLDDAEVKLEMISEVQDVILSEDAACGCEQTGLELLSLEDGNGEEGNNEQFGDEGASKRDFCGCDIKDTFEHVEG